MKRYLPLISLLGCAAANAAGIVVPVEFDFSGEDTIGHRLAYELKEQLRASRTMTVAPAVGMRMKAVIVTMDPESSAARQNNRTIYSVVILLGQPSTTYSYVTSSVGTCGSDRTRDCANGVLAEISSQAGPYEFFFAPRVKP